MKKQIILTIIALLTISVSAMASEFSPQKRGRTTTSRQGKVNTKNPTSAAEQNSLGIKCLYDQNEEKAVYWFRKAAEQGYVPAQCNLGECLLEDAYSCPVKSDNKNAIYWLRKAAEKGDAQAQYDLGQCYEYGWGISKDLKQAANLYRKAAEQGHYEAQFSLSVCYLNGWGVAKDLNQSKYWDEKHFKSKDYCDKNHIDWVEYYDIVDPL